MSKTYIYEITDNFEYNNRIYKVGEFLFEIEGREKLGIGDIQDGLIINPVPAWKYADRIRPYRNYVKSKVNLWTKVLSTFAMVKKLLIRWFNRL